MGLRFQKRIRLFKGLTLNLSKSGTSWTVGKPGASVNVRDDKITGSAGIPGTGLSYRQSLASTDSTNSGTPRRSSGRMLFWVIVVILIAWALLR